MFDMSMIGLSCGHTSRFVTCLYLQHAANSPGSVCVVVWSELRPSQVHVNVCAQIARLEANEGFNAAGFRERGMASVECPMKFLLEVRRCEM